MSKLDGLDSPDGIAETKLVIGDPIKGSDLVSGALVEQRRTTLSALVFPVESTKWVEDPSIGKKTKTD